jgi:hypothetical protein
MGMGKQPGSDRFVAKLILMGPKYYTDSLKIPSVIIETESFNYGTIENWLLKPETETALEALLFCTRDKRDRINDRAIARILFEIHNQLKKLQIAETLGKQDEKRKKMIGVEPRQPD